jgi:hypothetical protein
MLSIFLCPHVIYNPTDQNIILSTVYLFIYLFLVNFKDTVKLRM